MRQTLIKAPLFRAALLSALIIPAGACMAQEDKAAAHEQAVPAADSVLAAALAAPTRTPANVARDKYRHPTETLAFFGVDPGDTVVELWPGGGWYTEVLAPYIGEAGKLYVVPSVGRSADSIAKKIASDPVYSHVTAAPVDPGKQPSAIPAGSADVVLTFRNVHNWLGSENNTPIAEAVFAEAFRVLKPGGTFGVVEHRLPEDADAAREKQSGYVKVSTIKALAEKAGFRFAEASDVNANPKDTHDHPGGVWALPPTYTNKDVDRAKYEAIGESDRMTLKFVKPE
ncbi:class I SAM-dependent methyltransferase [Allosphingosinicella sp.]|uniref:class I SAM-dependent methyltransferase n=1 Tax=Allosphingosinicella sp. TaxID=2823234 RepID=UPI002FC20840